MRIAIIGASGFIGLRATEMLHLGGWDEVRPVVRAAASLAVLARMRLDWRVCDLLKSRSLGNAVRGCDTCIHAAIGDSSQIVRMASAAYEGCAGAQVSRLVWLSSASVHGQNPEPGTDERSDLHVGHPFAYNNAKVRAEWELAKLSDDGRVEVVILRPSIVFGPRSRWITDAAESLLKDRACWLNQGRGICNSIYVDNLIEAIRLALVTTGIAGETFLVRDHETVRWRDFLLPISQALGFAESAFQCVAPSPIRSETEGWLAGFITSPLYGDIGAYIPDRPKRIIKAIARAARDPEPPVSPWRRRTESTPKLSAEMTVLQQCEWEMPYQKAEQTLGYKPTVQFSDGMERSLSWLEFAGFPMRQNR